MIIKFTSEDGQLAVCCSGKLKTRSDLDPIGRRNGRDAACVVGGDGCKRLAAQLHVLEGYMIALAFVLNNQMTSPTGSADHRDGFTLLQLLQLAGGGSRLQSGGRIS